MNTANLQLEGLYLSLAALSNLLVSKGVVSREEVDGALESAEQTALTDYRAEELRPAHRDAVAFPPVSSGWPTTRPEAGRRPASANWRGWSDS